MGKVGLERHLIACEQEDQNIDPYSPSKFWVGVVAHLQFQPLEVKTGDAWSKSDGQNSNIGEPWICLSDPTSKK